MTGAFDGHRKAALVLQAGAGDAAWQDFALLIHKLQQEVRIFVVNVLDTGALEAAVFFQAGLRTDLVYRCRPNNW